MKGKRRPERSQRRRFLKCLVGSSVCLGGTALSRSNATFISSQGKSSQVTLAPCINHSTTMTTDFKTAMEAYGKAGFRAVELWLQKVDEYLPQSSLGEMKRIVSDQGLKAVSACSAGSSLFFPRLTDREKRIDGLKRRLELCRELGVPMINSPSVIFQADVKKEDFDGAIPLVHEVGEIARGLGIKIVLESIKGSTFLGCLTSVLELCRRAKHPYVLPMMDTFHFYAGVSKLEDLDLLEQGELAHFHIDDVPGSVPREILTDADRILPGEGVIPLRAILSKLKARGYSGVASLELFNRQLWTEDPFAVARRALASLQRIIS